MDEESSKSELAAANNILRTLIAKKAECQKQHQAEMGRFDDQIARTHGLISALGGGVNERRPSTPLSDIRKPRKRGMTNGKTICSIVEASEPEGSLLGGIVSELNEIKPRSNGEAWTNKQTSNECNDLRRKKLLWKDDQGRWHPGTGPDTEFSKSK